MKERQVTRNIRMGVIRYKDEKGDTVVIMRPNLDEKLAADVMNPLKQEYEFGYAPVKHSVNESDFLKMAEITTDMATCKLYDSLKECPAH